MLPLWINVADQMGCETILSHSTCIIVQTQVSTKKTTSFKEDNNFTYEVRHGNAKEKYAKEKGAMSYGHRASNVTSVLHELNAEHPKLRCKWKFNINESIIIYNSYSLINEFRVSKNKNLFLKLLK